MIADHDEIKEQVYDLWKSGGLPRGSSTGYPSLDPLYTVAMGQWTLLTGYPGSGKSNFLDSVLVNLAKREEWKFLIYSPENWPLQLHHSTILEKYLGKPFNPGPTERMNEDDIDSGEEWMRGKFFFAKPERPHMVAILGEAVKHFSYPVPSARRFKVGVVLDPWNHLEHHRPGGKSETEYVSEALSEVIRVARDANMHIWIVAHPAKTIRGKDGKSPVPTPQDVSGSAHFWNKADCAITVWRNYEEGSTHETDIHVQKIRFRHIGHVGLATLRYSRITGQYSEIPKPASVASYYDKEPEDVNF